MGADFTLVPRSLDEAASLAAKAAASGMISCRRPEEALIILLTGLELGLRPMQAFRGIYVVNGRPVLSADLLVACVRASGLCKVWRVLESTAERCTIETVREGDPTPRALTWTKADADLAGLPAKGGTWKQYPRQMLKHRTAADLVREVYPDVVLGLYTADEMGGEERDMARASVEVQSTPVRTLESPVRPPVLAHSSPQVEAALREVEAEARHAAQMETHGQEVEAMEAEPGELTGFLAEVAKIELPGESVALWLKHRAELSSLAADHSKRAWNALLKKTAEVGRMGSAKAAKAWLSKAIQDEEARRPALAQPSTGDVA